VVRRNGETLVCGHADRVVESPMNQRMVQLAFVLMLLIIVAMQQIG
jgi:hypothetical protein